LRAAGADVRQADLSDAAATLAALQGATAVIHVAAKAGIWGAYADFYRANVTATENVLAACRSHGIGRLVYTSTPSVVHGGSDVEGLDERAPIAVHFETAYPATKALAERAVLAAHGETLATVALRPHLIWGPDDPQLTARVIERARKGRLRLVGGGLKRIDATYIDNAARAHLLALDALGTPGRCGGRAYFIAQGEPMAQRDLIQGMLAAAGLPPCSRSLPAWLAWSVGAICEAVWHLLGRTDEPPMTRFLARQLATAHWFDLSAARRDLGYEATVTTAEGLWRLRDSLQGPHALR
jgi:nucleoside-diphosphate-sugar epimerase